MNRSLLDTYTLKGEVLDHLGEEASISVYAFAKLLSRFSRPTRDIHKLEKALAEAYDDAHGGTRLAEAIMQTCNDATKSASSTRRMMLIFSDGFDNGDLPAQSAANTANFFGIQLYPVELGNDEVIDRAMGHGGGGGQRPAGRALHRFGQRNPRQKKAAQGGVSSGRCLSRRRAREGQIAKFAELGPSPAGATSTLDTSTTIRFGASSERSFGKSRPNT